VGGNELAEFDVDILGKLPPTEQNDYRGADFDFVDHWIIENELIDEKESLSLVSLGEREQVLSREEKIQKERYLEETNDKRTHLMERSFLEFYSNARNW